MTSRALPAVTTAGRGLALPSTRAFTGGLLTAVACLGIWVAHSMATAPPATSFLVATAPIERGQPLNPGLFEPVAMTLPPNVAATALTPDAVASLTGPAASALPAGGLASYALTVQNIDASGSLATVSLPLDRAMGGRLSAGSIVDVWRTPGGGTPFILAERVPITSIQHDASGLSTGLLVTFDFVSRDELAAVLEAWVSDGLSLTIPLQAAASEEEADADLAPESPPAAQTQEPTANEAASPPAAGTSTAGSEA